MSMESRGYTAGLMGQPSLPGTYVEADRRAYESAYDIGRRAREAERQSLGKGRVGL